MDASKLQASPARGYSPVRSYILIIGAVLVAIALPLLLATCQGLFDSTPGGATIIVTPSSALSLAAIGATAQLKAIVEDQHGDTVRNADVGWTTSSAAVVVVNATGLATAVGNGSARVIVSAGVASTNVAVTVGQVIVQAVKVAGDSQIAAAGQPLGQPLVLRVNDAIGHGVAGVNVRFAVAGGSGSVQTASATTDAAGQAQTNWTLGQPTGNQTATATASGSGISGNPAVFIARSVVPGWALTLVAWGLNGALHVTAPPGDTERIFVVQQTGVIRVSRGGALLATPFLDLSGTISCCEGERGLLSMAFHPNYASNGRFFVDYTDPNGTVTVARFRVSANSNVADPASREIILTIPHAAYPTHNGGLVTFGPDGYLYIGTGDGGNTLDGDPLRTGQDSTKLLAKILRIDVNGAFPYAIPPSNPFVGRPPAAPEVWAYGLRNPWRFAFDRVTGDLYIADVGQYAWDEVDYAPAGDRGGHNYGWSTMEGTACFRPATGCVKTGLVLPVYQYIHEPPRGACAIIGGSVYRGNRASIRGRYFFADYCAGWVRSLRMQGGIVADVVDHTGELGLFPGIRSFGEDGRGDLYVTVTNGEVYRILQQ